MSFFKATEKLEALLKGVNAANNAAADNAALAHKTKLVVIAAAQSAIGFVENARANAVLVGLTVTDHSVPAITEDMSVDDLSTILFDMQDEAISTWSTILGHFQQMHSLVDTLSNAMGTMLIDSRVPKPAESLEITVRARSRLPNKLQKRRPAIAGGSHAGSTGDNVELRDIAPSILRTPQVSNREVGADNVGTATGSPNPELAEILGGPMSRNSVQELAEYRRQKLEGKARSQRN